MSGLLERVGSFFVAPPVGAESASDLRRRAAAAPSVAVLCTTGDSEPTACALALLLAREGDGHAAVCTWRARGSRRPSWRAPASPGARRLAGRLAGEGLEVEAAGRLGRVLLPDDPLQATAAADRVAACARAPIVIAIGGPRDREIDGLLAVQDAVAVVVRGEDSARLAEIAQAGLAETVRACVLCSPPAGPAARAAALAGLVAGPGAARGMTRVLEAAR